MENNKQELKIPNLSEPRVRPSEANPEGIGVFFAIVRVALNEHKWARPDFEAVKFVEGQVNALEAYFETARNAAKQNPPQPATDAPAPVPEAPAPNPAPTTNGNLTPKPEEEKQEKKN